MTKFADGALLDDAARRARRYLDELGERSVAPTAAAIAGMQRLGGLLPEAGLAPAKVLALLDEAGSPATIASAGGRYFGFVTGGVLPAALAAGWLGSAWDQNAFSTMSSPVGAAIESVALGWIKDVLALPDDCAGAFVTGATMANFTSLAAARHAVLARAGWDAEADGLFGAPPVTVVVGEEVHATLFKIIGLLGLGRERVLRVPVDEQGRMVADAMPALAGPTIVCVQAGNVNSGAFDPIGEICARVHGDSDGDGDSAWVHVDGAFGLWAAAAPARAASVAGADAADSWATDAHKWLNVSYDSGIALVRDAAALRAAMSMSAAYLPSGSSREPFHYTPESSRRARGIEIWAALLSLGRRGLADLVERNCAMASRMADALGDAGYEVLNDVVLNQVLVAFGDADTTNRVVTAVQDDGVCWCGPTVWKGRAAMRISVSSWATSDEDIETSIGAILKIAADTAGPGN
ncbi:MAG: pyridoxal-dependent decarboxylase [Gammaproteobacteria bacterium]|nr:pyridoxal-dependent decarboxylase [Gammaproteobacteria bacterium]MDX2462216.1 pyridoxal-dependent decarboxylase [Gammaproteobacteria bacterium]